MEKSRIMPESLEHYYWSSDAHIHPQGDRIAYVRKTIDIDSNSYVTRIHTVGLHGGQDQQLSSGQSDSQPFWSPTGEQLGFLRNVSGINGLYVIGADGSEERLVLEAKRSIQQWQWLSDGSGFVYVTSVLLDDQLASMSITEWSQKVSRKGASYSGDMPRAEGRGWWNEHYNHLFHYDLASGEVRQLTSGAFHVSQPRVIHNDKVSFIAQQEKGVPQAASEVMQGLYVLDLQVALHAEDTERYQAKSQQSHRQLQSTDVKFHASSVGTARTTMQQLVSGSYEISHYSWSSRGDYIVFIGHDRSYGAATHNQLYRVTYHPGRVNSYEPALISTEDIQLGVYVLNDMTAGVSHPGPYLFTNDAGEDEIYALASHHGEVQLWRWTSSRSGQSSESSQSSEMGSQINGEQLTNNAWVIHQLSASATASTFVIQAIDGQAPGELYVIKLGRGNDLTSKPLTSWNAAFVQQHAIAHSQSIWFTNDEGTKIQGWLLLPPSTRESLLEPRQESLTESIPVSLPEPSSESLPQSIPLILAIHGGPHAMYTPAYSHEFQVLASEGYAVLLCNPRGSFGYGQTFAKGCLQDVGRGDYQDLMLAVDYALDEFEQLNARRLGVIGGSYGGLMTNWIIGQNKRFQAAVSQRSISNWLSFYGNSDIGPRYTEAMLGAHPWDNAELLWQRSPIAYADKVETPVLIMHGEQDLRCPIEQSDQWYTSLKRWGKRAKLVRYAGSNHAFQKLGKPALRVDVLEEVNAWFKDYLQHPVELGIPFAMLLENLRSSGASDASIATCLANKDFTVIAHLTMEPDMPFVERAELAEELKVNWQDVFTYGYRFSFLHANALKRLLWMRYQLQENLHFTQNEFQLTNVQLAVEQVSELEKLIERQWKIEERASGYDILRRIEAVPIG